MRLRQVVWFLAAYIGSIALAIWFNLAVLCRGAAKYDGGCGGFGVYIPLWLIFLAPLALAAIVLERWRWRRPPTNARVMAYLAGIVIIGEAGFLLIDKFPVLLAVEVMAIAAAGIVRARAA